MSHKKNIYSSIDTPAVLIDLDQVEANIQLMMKLATEAKLKLRPHIKIHQCTEIAKMQIKAGAHGVEVGNVDQAEAMVEAGIDDIMIVHPFYGDHKYVKLKKFINKPDLKISIVVDMVEQAAALSQIGLSLNMKVPVLIKIDSGAFGVDRFGVRPGEAVLKLAREIRKLQGVTITGIYAHESQAVPTEEGVKRVALEVGSIMVETARVLRREGFALEHVAVGSSPSFKDTCEYIKQGMFSEITEIHPGAMVIGDILYLRSRGNTLDTCALTVLVTAVSTSHPTHFVIDAGYKTFGPAALGDDRLSYGLVKGRPELWIRRTGAESMIINYLDNTGIKVELGDRLEIIPNYATLVLNIYDTVYGVRNGKIEREIKINGRGRGS